MIPRPANSGISLADALPRRRWTFFAKVLAYLLMVAIASASVWLIDRLAMREMHNFNPPMTPQPAAASPAPG